MSAKWDRNQGVGFYYGNAVRDLADVLPADEAHTYAPSNPEHEAHMRALDEFADRLQAQADELVTKHAELSFLISDLRRMIR